MDVFRLSRHALQELIHATASEPSRVLVSRHGWLRMRQRNVSYEMAIEVLRMGRILLPPEPNVRFGTLECRMERICAGRRLAVVAAVSNLRPEIVLVTVFET